MAFNAIVSWVFFPFFWSWLKFVYQNPIKWVQETDNDSRAHRQNWSKWEVNIDSPGPKSINSKWVMLFVLFLFFLFIYSHLITRKKKTWFNFGISLWTRLSFHGLKTIKIYFFFFFKIDLSWAFDHVCYKMFYDYPSLDCKNVTLNMFATMYDN